jgi:hypothetical protein
MTMKATKKATKRVRLRVHDARPTPRGPRLSLGGTPLRRWSPVFAATRQLVMATIDLAERAVADVPEEREKVENVRALAEARFDGREPPRIDPLDIAFTIGLVGTLAESDFSQPGLSSLLLELLPLGPAYANQPMQETARRQPRRGGPVGLCRLCLDEYQF